MIKLSALSNSLLALALLLITFAPAKAVMNSAGEMIIVAEYVEAEKVVKTGNFDEALKLLRETIRQYPGHASAWNLMGYIHRMQGKFDMAEEYYDAALTLNPNHTGALSYMGQLFLQTGRPDKAKGLLVRLKGVCTEGCDALNDLQKAIDTGVAGNY